MTTERLRASNCQGVTVVDTAEEKRVALEALAAALDALAAALVAALGSGREDTWRRLAGALALLGGERIEGWKAIAAAVGVSVTRARELADPKRKFQLPVRYGARGVYVARVALEGWFAQYDAPYGAHAGLKAPRRSENTSAT